MPIRLATWNLCLGLQNKRDLVLHELDQNKIDICCLQETEINNDYPINILSSSNYTLETENNDIKRRVAVYIRNQINYTRRIDLEEPNTHVIIIDLIASVRMRIITLYRSFRPPGNDTPINFFRKQLYIVERNIVQNTFILGDFNLDAEMRYRIDYPHKYMYHELNKIIEKANLEQLVHFPTWARSVSNVLKQSTLDHIYTNNLLILSECTSIKPPFGDHLLVIAELNTTEKTPEFTIRRDWRLYTKEILLTKLLNVNLSIDCNEVQQYWNIFENILINIVDEIVPLKEFSNENAPKKNPPHNIQNSINKRKRLIKKQKQEPSVLTHNAIKMYDKEIKKIFYTQKCNFIRSKILPGNNKSLWAAVKVAKNQSINSIPKSLLLNNVPVCDKEVANEFAEFFHNKIEKLKRQVKINNNVHNGYCKLLVDNRFFMNANDVEECLLSLKPKNAEGFDRIPVRILYDARELLKDPLAALFQKIYEQKTIPEQWKMAKVIPIFKKGPKNLIENYRPIANLCSTSKIFEKLILKQIKYLETINKLDFTGKQQHGFKINKSTATCGLLLQSIIARATDENNYVLMASLDLSAAFDIVNVGLLLKRLRILGLPKDLVKLIEVWLTDRQFYVEVNGLSSPVYRSNDGTIQGSVLGPILYAIFVSPIFDLTDLTNFADDNYVIEINAKINELIINMEKGLK